MYVNFSSLRSHLILGYMNGRCSWESRSRVMRQEVKSGFDAVYQLRRQSYLWKACIRRMVALMSHCRNLQTSNQLLRVDGFKHLNLCHAVNFPQSLSMSAQHHQIGHLLSPPYHFFLAALIANQHLGICPSRNNLILVWTSALNTYEIQWIIVVESYGGSKTLQKLLQVLRFSWHSRNPPVLATSMSTCRWISADTDPSFPPSASCLVVQIETEYRDPSQ